MKIQHKLLVSYSVVIGVICVGGLIGGALFLAGHSDYSQSVASTTSGIQSLLEVKAKSDALLEVAGVSPASRAHSGARESSLVHVMRQEINQHIADAAADATDELERAQIARIDTFATTLIADSERLITLRSDQGAPQAIRELEVTLLESRLPLFRLIDRAIGVKFVRLHDYDIALQRRQSTAGYLGLALILFAALAGFVQSYMASKKFIRSVHRLRDNVNAAGTGNFNTISDFDPSDEIGELAVSIQRVFADLNVTTVSKVYTENILKSMSDTLIVIDRYGNIQSVNDAALTMLGYGKSELIGNPIGMVIDDPEFIRKSGLSEPSEKSVASNVEVQYVTKDGSRIPMFFSCSVMGDGAAVNGVVCVAQDIRDRKKTEAMLETQLRAIESSMDGIAILDANELIAYANDSLRQMHGQADDDSESVVGQSWSMFYSAEETARLHKDVMPEFKAHGRWQGEARGLRRDGTTYDQEIALSAVADGGMVMVVRDITDRKQKENELREYREQLEERVNQRTIELETINKELEAFCYSISHDLRTPLRGIDGFSQILVDEFYDTLGEDGRHYLDRVQAGTKRMGTLIDALLKFSQVTRSDVERVPVDLSALVSQVVEDVETAEPDRRVTVEIMPDLKATGDPPLLRIMLANLINNAGKFTSECDDAKIEFGMVTENGNAHYFVRDNGAGFDEAFQEKLFVPFERLHRDDEYQGTGIGLATAQRIIHRHNGRIWATGKVNKGATFYFTLN